MLNRLIEIAIGEVGVKETGENIVKYNDWYWGNSYKANGADYPWCVVFLAYIFEKAGVPFPHVAHCNLVESYAKAHEQWVTAPYRVGDAVIFDYDRNGNRDHIGYVVKVDGNTLITVEGNYGNKVSKVTRKASEPVGAYRPDYREQPEEPAKETEQFGNSEQLPVLRKGDYDEAVGALQVLLKYHGYKMPNSFTRAGKPDCDFGAETETALLDLTGATETHAAAWSKLIGGLG